MISPSASRTSAEAGGDYDKLIEMLVALRTMAYQEVVGKESHERRVDRLELEGGDDGRNHV
jgi:hypothetical protein